MSTTLLDRVTYTRPTALADALALLAEPGAVALAGGTDLVNGIRLGATEPRSVVDIGAVPDLRAIDDGEPVSIGAGVTIREFREHPTLARRLLALADAAALLGGRQIQAMATFGGNLCNASPAAETATPLLVLGAAARIAGAGVSGNGERAVPLAELWTGPGSTVLEPGELLVAIELPAGLDGTASAYRRLELRRSVDIALVSASCWLQLDGQRITDARIGLGAVAPTPVLAAEAAAELIDVEVADAGRLSRAIARCTLAAARMARPIDDHRASAEYRTAMVETMVGRAVEDAANRARREARDE